MGEHYPVSKSSVVRVKVELDLSNYATKADVKHETSADISKFARKVELANLKPGADKLHFDELKNVSSKLKSKLDKLDVNKLISTCSCWFK